jgi:hypothetical protein
VVRFIGDAFGADIADELLRVGSRAGQIDEVIELLERHGLIAETLFVELLRRTPGLTDEILAVARLWCDPSAVERFVRTRGEPGSDCAGAPDAVAARIDVDARLARDCAGWRRGEGNVIRCAEPTRLTDLCLELTVLNRLEDSLVVTGVGLHVAEIRHPARVRPAAGVPFVSADFSPRRLVLFDVLRVTVDRFSDLQWRTVVDWDAAREAVERCFVAEFEEPVLLPAQAAVRFKLGVDGLFMSHDVVVRARPAATTVRGLVRGGEWSLES